MDVTARLFHLLHEDVYPIALLVVIFFICFEREVIRYDARSHSHSEAEIRHLLSLVKGVVDADRPEWVTPHELVGSFSQLMVHIRSVSAQKYPHGHCVE